MTPVIEEPLLGYHPCDARFLNELPNRQADKCQAGSLIRVVASQGYREALKGSLGMVGNHSESAKAEGRLTGTLTGGAGRKLGLSDPVDV